MAHPKLPGRVDRRVFLAAGAAATLMGLPATASAGPLDDLTGETVDVDDVSAGTTSIENVTAGAVNLDLDDVSGSGNVDDATPNAAPLQGLANTEVLGTVDDTDVLGTVDDAVDCVTASCEDPTGTVSDVTNALPEEVKAATDPLTGVVGDVLRGASDAVNDPAGTVESVPDVVGDVVRDVGSAVPGVDVPLPAPDTPEDVGTAGSPAGVSSGPVQGPRTSTRPPFTPRRTTVTTSLPTRPATSFYSPPVITAPFAGDLPRLAEDFLSPSQVSSGVEAIRDAAAGGVPGPDAPSWLLATAGGLLLLVGSGHVFHARNRHRYAASVAR